MPDFQENGFLSGILVSTQQSQYTIRNLISKLAPNWLTNVKVIELTFFWDRPSVPGKMFSGIKSDFSRVLLDSRG